MSAAPQIPPRMPPTQVSAGAHLPPRIPPRLPPRSQSEKYFARVARDDLLLSRNNKLLGLGGWVVCGGEFYQLIPNLIRGHTE